MGLKMVGLTFLFLSDWDLFHRTFSRPNFRTYFRKLLFQRTFLAVTLKYFDTARMYFDVFWYRQDVLLCILIQTGCTLIYFDSDRMYFDIFWYRQDVLWCILIQPGCTLMYFDTDRMYFDIFKYSQDVLWCNMIQPGCTLIYFDTARMYHVLWCTLINFEMLSCTLM